MQCANCGSESTGRFCPVCGQNDRDYQRELPPLLADLIRETLDIDSRLLRSVKLLLFRPGELSLEFSRNRRASYVSPFRFYLVVSVLFFFVFSLTTDVSVVDAPAQVEVEVAESAGTETDLEPLLQVLDEEHAAKVRRTVAGDRNPLGRAMLEGLARELASEEGTPGPSERYLIAQLVDAVDNPRETAGRLLDNLPIAAFFMLPVFAGLLSLFYRKRRRYYVENLVFATHLHTFAFLIYTVLLLLPDGGTLESALLLVLFLYHLIALKRYYQEGALRTFFKCCAQLLFYFALLFPTAIVLVVGLTLATV